MCNPACLEFVAQNLLTDEVENKQVIEVGSLDVNGSVRSLVQRQRPAGYLGVDISAGPGVDEICDATELLTRFGRERFDLLISTELLEHVRDWRTVVSNFKNILKPGGVLVLTTRSRGKSFHGYPFDFWRYEVSDMRRIFSDFEVTTIQTDPLSPGVFVKARRPTAFSECELDSIQLYSILTRNHRATVSSLESSLFRCLFTIRRLVSRVIPESLRRFLRPRSPS